MTLSRPLAAALLACLFTPSQAAEPLPIEHFLKQPTFIDMKISPDGRHLAVTVPQGDDQTVLAVVDRQTMKPTAILGMRGREHVDDFVWVSDERLVVSAAKKEGMLDAPIPTGELFAVDADGKGSELLFGYRLAASGSQASNIKKPAAERASAYLIDTLPDNDSQVLIAVHPWMTGERGTFSEARLLNVKSGRTSKVATSPIPLGTFLADRDGNVRLSWGVLPDHNQKVYLRPAKGGDWSLIHDEATREFRIWPIAFHEDGRRVYVTRESVQAPNALYLYDTASGEMTSVLADARWDIGTPLFGAGHQALYGVRLQADVPKLAFIDPSSRQARLAKAIADAFPGQHAYFTSFTDDGGHGLVHVYSDRNSGEFYLFDLATMKAHYLAASREWMDPEAMAPMRPIRVKARDGRMLEGYLVLPPGSDGKAVPLVVNPHGGPHGIRDVWGFNAEAQLLASRGYAVLKLNFRGSGGYGRAFEQAGYRQWGGAMQDDVADAVRWAVAEGHADPERVCIYGGSYGGYTALMNSARYPDLYRCTVGYAGVYDLRLMYSDGDIKQTLYGRSYLDLVLGNQGLTEASPVSLADRIKMPVLLVHGGEDFRVPQAHADRMRAALREAGNDPEWLVERREGHGFYNMDSRVKLYTQLLAFFDRHIGAGRASTSTAAAN